MRFILIFILVAAPTEAQILGTVRGLTSSVGKAGTKALGLNSQLKIRGNVDDSEIKGLLSKNSDLLSLKGNGLLKVADITNLLGVKTKRFHQTFNGVRVWGSDVVTTEQSQKSVDELSKDTNKPTGAKKNLKSVVKSHGKFIKGLDKLFPDVNFNTLLKKGESHGKSFANSRALTPEATFVEPIIYTEGETAMTAFYVHSTGTSDTNDGNVKEAILNENGDVIQEWDGLKSSRKVATGSGGNTKSGRFSYGSNGVAKFEVDEVGSGKCAMKTGSNLYTVDLKSKSVGDWMSGYPQLLPYAKANVVKFSCYQNSGRYTNGAYSPINDAHARTQNTIDMIKSYYGDDIWYGRPVIQFVHCKDKMENAYYNKVTYYARSGSGYKKVYVPYICIGDGKSRFYPLVSQDVLSHELGHGITDFNSDLVYKDQSGGINEAFSDMTGMAVLNYMKEPVTYKFASEIMKSSGQLRCMDNPPCDGRSADHVNDLSSIKNDPHYTSGIFNKVFYLLSSPKSRYAYKYGAWDAYDVFYTANKHKWTSTSDFNDAAEGVLSAVDDLRTGMYYQYSYTHLSVANTVSAFRSVGIYCSKTNNNWVCR